MSYCGSMYLGFFFFFFFLFFREMGQSGTDSFKLKRDWLSVQEVVDAVTSPSCGAISVFIGEDVFTFPMQTFPLAFQIPSPGVGKLFDLWAHNWVLKFD